jgi:hypothetical protein
MKDIPGIDENGNPKNGPFEVYFKNGSVSCLGEFDNGKNQEHGNTFSTMDNCNHQATTITGRL